MNKSATTLKPASDVRQRLRHIAYTSILELATEEGIHASGKADVFACIFGRDSAITILKLLKACTNPHLTLEEKNALLAIIRRSLLTLVSLQGKEINIESGEQPGKFIHEYRKDNYERLLTFQPIPWYIYPDKTIKNYDSLDSTALILLAILNYWKVSNDSAFLEAVLPSVKKGLAWIMKYGDLDGDYLVEYELPTGRKAGGLAVQSWTDSYESLLDTKKEFPPYPIAPVEVQGITWLSLKEWARFFGDGTREGHDAKLTQSLTAFALKMKKQFNTSFTYTDQGQTFLAQVLDGEKKQKKVATGNPMMLLWATFEDGDTKDSIIESSAIPEVVKRTFMKDMFEEDSGIRTMSTKSPTFNPNVDSYHNGSFWPMLNGMAHEGLMRWGFEKEAERLETATLIPLAFFDSMVELYIKTGPGAYSLYISPDGQESCRQQAWSAAAALDILTL